MNSENEFKDEAELEAFCCEFAVNEYRLCHVKFERCGKGFPDRMFFRKRPPQVPGMKSRTTLFFVEFKDYGITEADKYQTIIHRNIMDDSGVHVYTLDTFEKFEAVCHEEIYS